MKIPDGTRSEGTPGHCALCHWSLGGSMEPRIAYWLDKKPYHPGCFPTIVAAEKARQELTKGKEDEG